MATVVWQPVRSRHWEGVLHDLVKEHERETHSSFAARLLTHWDLELPRFVQVCPKEMLNRLEQPLDDSAEAATA